MQKDILSAEKVDKFVILAERYRLEMILLFGSHAGDKINSESDVDIAICGDRVLDEKEKIRIVYEICNIIGSDKVDLVDIKTAPPLLKKEIFKNYRILCLKNPILLYQLELTGMYEFRESEILYQMRHERLQEFIK